MGKGKSGKRARSAASPSAASGDVANLAASSFAERHGFDSSGFLGHDSTGYTVNVSERTALAVDSVFACVRLIADLTADADVGEFRGTERLPSSRLVRRPMATISRRTWLWNVAATMALYNGCYYERMGGLAADGMPYSMVPIVPTRVTKWDGRVQLDGRDIDPDALGYIPRTSWPTVTTELGTVLQLARETFAAAWAADSYRADFWENGGAPVVVLSTDQELTGTQADAIADRWVEKRAAGPGKPAVLGKGAEAKTLGADIGADGASRASERLGAAVARYFGVPAWLVNVPTEAGSLVYANSSAAGLDLVRYTLRPGYAGPIGDAFSEELPGDPIDGRRVELSLRHLTIGTMLEQFQAYQIATGGQAWMLPSDVRADLGLPMDMTLDEKGAAAPAMEAIA